MTPAGQALFSGTALTSQLQDSEEELRRKKLLEQQQARLLPSSSVSMLGLSPAGYSLALGR